MIVPDPGLARLQAEATVAYQIREALRPLADAATRLINDLADFIRDSFMPAVEAGWEQLVELGEKLRPPEPPRGNVIPLRPARGPARPLRAPRSMPYTGRR